jgi:hypothetical protein
MGASHTDPIHEAGKNRVGRPCSESTRTDPQRGSLPFNLFFPFLNPISSRVAFKAVPKHGNLASALAREISMLLISLLPAFADPSPGAFQVSTSRASAPGAYTNVIHLGEPDQQAAQREGQLLSHRRAADPFGNAIRGPFKGLPPAVEHPTATPGQANAASQVAAAANLPTIEKAVQELAIGAVNVGAHEILIKSRPIHEGDLLVLESGGRQFVVWVQNVGVRGSDPGQENCREIPSRGRRISVTFCRRTHNHRPARHAPPV